ncbi:agmatine deiminase family protein [Flavobacterium salilacus subsp. salilacus]|uniref:agmatine deiminase family protein n=1 Tax=Flavobacterium TaxID=237 RepID=UPI001074C90D|nr:MULTISPECIES: agmatine deiminase family protein [Flavobacterium]KAF2516261.1 agmatine deiminase family protein [Flavobacterium salilacus subsp. salilacus]MBE1613789.1 agmatine deiminase family protein [Flavobacterium sp. SaA2.13]
MTQNNDNNHPTSDFGHPTPKQLGFTFPAEFAPQRALWLSWPHKEESWPGKLETVYKPYSEFILYVSRHQQVCINVADESMKQFAYAQIAQYTRYIADSKLENITFYFHPTNDAWCRDHGPAFVINQATGEKAIVDWGYNAWGDKYPPYDLDDVVPTKIGEALGLKVFHPNIVMEGGSVEFNGKGTLMTTTACLLNENRNPHLSKEQIEEYLKEYYGVEHILWLGDGIIGDDTDGHIDDITRFVNEDTVVTVIEENKEDENYEILQENLKLLQNMKLQDGSPLKIVELPMPKPVAYENQRLPASYANFYIANKCVIVPTFRDDVNDKKALEILQSCFKDREVIGIDSTDIIWGLGSFHCLSQQEPL